MQIIIIEIKQFYTWPWKRSLFETCPKGLSDEISSVPLTALYFERKLKYLNSKFMLIL